VLLVLNWQYWHSQKAFNNYENDYLIERSVLWNEFILIRKLRDVIQLKVWYFSSELTLRLPVWCFGCIKSDIKVCV
jgi:hypothetical protein